MSASFVRRSLIFGITVFAHTNNMCISGMCEPNSQHKQLVLLPDSAALLFVIAVALAIAEVDLWPRRWPFRPLQKNVIFVIELIMSLTINNLMLRLIWLPFVHFTIQHINCTLAAGLLTLGTVLFGRGKSNAFTWFGGWTCSRGGVEAVATLVAFAILAQVVYRLYGDRLKCIYRCMLLCACVSNGDSSSPHALPRLLPHLAHCAGSQDRGEEVSCRGSPASQMGAEVNKSTRRKSCSRGR